MRLTLITPGQGKATKYIREVSLEIRTRFAPSPTGYLHIGGARTALFNWLFARQHKGKIILRIEDTDAARSTEESVQAIIDGMQWLGLNWDEGPYFQSKQFDLYRDHAYKLIEMDKAYKCFCTPEELEQRRKDALAQGRPPKYDGRCRNNTPSPTLTKGGFTIRFRIPSGTTLVKDIVKGNIAFDNNEIEDLIILRSDGTPTYNLCVVVDDATMEITHVIRGDDHLNNTPKQMLLSEAFKYPIPAFAHLPMILGSDKTRLSKRHGATSVMAYKEMGYLPHALVNYLARLGWSYRDQEIFTIEELTEKFSLENVGKSSGIFNPEKLLWLNHHYIKESRTDELAKLLCPFLETRGYKVQADKRLANIIKTVQERSKTFVEMADAAEFYFKEDIVYEEKAAQKFLTQDMTPMFETLISGLESLPDFTHETLEAVFSNIINARGIKLGKIAQPARVALTGGTVSPGIFEVIENLGKEISLARLKKAIAFIEQKTK
ncbi:MAG TPA: glutamate--tRNA ligase [Thermodesulfobacteriota bacterium]|nr:glutamate--tRNA ligase [Thermodesulfobacteriota bacterium]